MGHKVVLNKHIPLLSLFFIFLITARLYMIVSLSISVFILTRPFRLQQSFSGVILSYSDQMSLIEIDTIASWDRVPVNIGL